MVNKQQLSITHIDNEIFEARFSFVKNDFIRENIKIYARYLTFLYSFGRKYNLHPDIVFSLYKDIIIYSAQIVEALCHYLISELIKNDEVENKILGREWRKVSLMNCKLLLPELEIQAGSYRVSTIIEKKVGKRFKNKINFKKLIDYCEHAGLPEMFIKRLSGFKDKRNKIHIGSLEFVDDVYTENDVSATLSDMSYIIDEIKQRLATEK
ncbi:MAG: hypothetical protein US52_C0045G0002 [candidate division WS6 bacterium GW2011_GWA2_37_6]|uniref:RiboL-PSP-HEPN domain-containing protein n=1 Tax=candidate division WS6 bacterium GW2011_GWA2_37_6 TaxID=1619087 RepID=A0A0G0GXQ9_9BACT|nr:MAG: hypothetical protein US52_C0045G0002 [candidate division WS6 bacterium GW2011_GWA2_37_6]